MKTIQKQAVLFSILFLSFAVSYGQDPKIISGAPTALSSIKFWNVKFVFNNPDIEKEGKEKDFVAKKTKEFNAEAPGKGDKWATTWEENKNFVYKPKFELLMNKYLAESGVVVGQKAEGKAKHTIIVETTWMYMGYNVAVMKQPSKVTSTISFVSDDAPDKPLFQVQMVESPGDVYISNPYSEFDRLTESYAKCGKDLAGYLKKKAYK